jgi:hypothetical protein
LQNKNATVEEAIHLSFSLWSISLSLQTINEDKFI